MFFMIEASLLLWIANVLFIFVFDIWIWLSLHLQYITNPNMRKDHYKNCIDNSWLISFIFPQFFCKAQMCTAEKWDRQGRSCQVVFQNCLSPSKSSPHQKHRCWCQSASDSLLGHFHFLPGRSSKEFYLLLRFLQGLLQFIQKGKLPTFSHQWADHWSSIELSLWKLLYFMCLMSFHFNFLLLAVLKVQATLNHVKVKPFCLSLYWERASYFLQE